MNKKGFLRLFLDTEFTSFRRGKLISFALVAEDGRSLYCELTHSWELRDCSDFVIQTVLPLLGPVENRLTFPQARQAVRAWVESLEQPAMIYTDSLYHDEPMFRWLFTGWMSEWPSNLDERFVHYSSDDIDPVFERLGLRRHHALDDAIALKECYIASKGHAK